VANEHVPVVAVVVAERRPLALGEQLFALVDVPLHDLA
jgi:hypothetical protein